MQKLFLLTLLPAIIIAHSWVSCTAYDRSAGSDASVYNGAKCTGWGRGWSGNCQGTNNQFGVDCGYNQQDRAKVCPTALNPSNYDAGYSSESKMATYQPGQTVCLAWPAKNHVAATCDNIYIPDSGTKIYISRPNPTADPTSVNDLRTNFQMIGDMGANPRAEAYLGFQNCPRFCQERDKALCTGCFVVPQDLQQGAVYSFFWAWAFNSVDDVYTSCWEARISGAVVTSPTSAAPVPASFAQTPATSRAQTPAATSRAQTPAATSQAQTPVATSRGVSSPAQSNPAGTDTCETTKTAAYCQEVCGVNLIQSCGCKDGDVSVTCLDGEKTSNAMVISLSSCLLYLLL